MLNGSCPNCKIGTMYFLGTFYRCLRCLYDMESMLSTMKIPKPKETWTYTGQHIEVINKPKQTRINKPEQQLDHEQILLF